ncbi:SLC13 family permease [Rhodococcus qingshengii]|uniref:SLC13 family permease n=1 Tax=Rhodococcus qingshengii TaxID=334542 RepID=UPI001AE0E3D7|nr:SLC13 family permease [Rhodococcus qingshengii]MCQ4147173.1 SLC13 family permease [Rhodococcus qingshengii]MCT6733652.1 SLC13 family permease [Rhodococcus qingshengii]MDJ0434237.1 SLC13 family permease [Rhodococcus qingshengii]
MANVIALSVLVLVFVISTVRSVNMGALALVAAFVVGTLVFTVDTSEILDGFPASLFVILVGVTYLFALARNNGTVDWIIHAAVRAVRGRVALVPWAMFAVCAAVTAMGAVSPAAVAIIAPVAMGFATRYRIHPMLMGFMVVQGATAGSFSPIGIFGVITNDVMRQNGLPSSPALLFVSTFAAAAVVAAIAYVSFGGRALIARGASERVLVSAVGNASGGGDTITGSGSGDSSKGGGKSSGGTAPHEGALNLERRLTLLGLASLALGALVFDLDVGFTALTVAVLLTLIFPASARGAVDKISWGTVLLIGGIVTYVALLQNQNTVQWLGDSVAHVGIPLLAAFLICLIGAIVSAFASTTGILGALIPLAIPFLMTGQVNATGLVIALAISSSLVDCSPFSTNGALVVANSAPEERDVVFGLTMRWGMTIMVVTPILAWLLFVVPWSV